MLTKKDGGAGVVAKLGDFGTALRLTDEEPFAIDAIGTLGYMAPEIYNPGKYGLSADIFSFAVVAWATFSQSRNNPMAVLDHGDADDGQRVNLSAGAHIV